MVVAPLKASAEAGKDPNLMSADDEMMCASPQLPPPPQLTAKPASERAREGRSSCPGPR